jgi:hypothetical protein
MPRQASPKAVWLSGTARRGAQQRARSGVVLRRLIMTWRQDAARDTWEATVAVVRDGSVLINCGHRW